MKKRDPKKQAKLQKITTKRAQYEKARKQKAKRGSHVSWAPNKSDVQS